jgi:IS4 transposase
MFDWAKFRSKKGGVKLHLVLDYDGCLPVFAQVTKARKHEVKIAQKLQFPAGSVVVFDMGYIDFTWFNVLDSSKVFFVTRMKDSTDFSIIKDYKINKKKDPNMLQDADIQLEGFYSRQYYPSPLRMVRILDSITREELFFLTNNFDWTARTVADIYKERWNIEIFFKQIKQHLRIKSFIGTSQNAVQIQIWTALITMLLLQYLKAKAQYGWHLSNLTTFIRINLFTKIALMEWLNKPFLSNKEIDTQQFLIFSG